ncbi:MAG: response regulator [Hydrogenophaga sp.]|uniref:response regulator n=1 Tax=Hydrogenophaga sp. TaxID=1904254 RepID=UPI0027257A06|nr:response regulator [Hydrogenophaga sp.]MDO9504342.1 response regulator [Hydrogenophaga sp.]MDP3204658.1 response regulator [Hydrogenophaga sp.]MDP3628740.1 response regulator [Hydrogenophaga sp.]
MKPVRSRREKTLASLSLTAVILCLGLVVSALSAYTLARRVQADAQADFWRKSDLLTTEISQRLSASEYGLRGARGAFVASERVDRGEFKALVDSMDMQHTMPGNRGFGWIDRVQRSDLPAYLREMRAGDSPGLTLRQFGEKQHDTLYVIRYIEPEALNQGAMGADVGSDPRGRAAIEHAIASGETTLTPPVPLTRDGSPSPGFLLLKPVYATGATPATEAERRALLKGVLYAPLIARDVLRGINGTTDDLLTFQLYTNREAPSLENWIAGFHAIEGGKGITRTDEPRMPSVSAYSQELHFKVHGRTFTVLTSSTNTFEASVTQTPALVVLGVGILLTLALAWMASHAARAQRHAEALARSMTIDLERLAVVARRTSNAVVITDAQRRITWVNAGFERMSGYSMAEVLGQEAVKFLQFEGTDVRELARLRDALNAGEPFLGELLNRGKHGREYWIELEIQQLMSDAGKFLGFMAIQNDVTERHLSAAALQSSQAFLDRTGRIGGVGGWAMDLATRQVRWTDQTCRIHDREPGHMPSLKEALSYFPAGSRSVIEAGFKLAMESGQAFDVELPLITARGRAIWVRAAGELDVRDGVPRSLVGAMQDITAAKQLSEAMERSNELLSNVIESLPCALSVVDSQGKLLLANTEFGRLFSLPPHLCQPGVTRFADMVRFSALRGDFGPGDIDELVHEIIYTANHAAPKQQFERTLVGGEVIELRRGRMDKGGFVSTYTDISARREAEAQARRSQDLMSSALEVTGAGLVIFDPSDRLVFCNDRYRELYSEISDLLKPGAVFEEIVRANLALHEPPAAQGRREEWVAERVRDHRLGGDWERRIPGGRTLRVVERALPDGHVVSFRIDITNVVRATEAAEAASRSKSQFLANMSHEIRTPMNAILGMLSLLQRTHLTTRQLDYADKAESAARSLLGLLNDILDFSKVEAGKLVLDPHPFGVDQLLRDLAVVLSASVGDKEIEVLFDIDPDLPGVLFGDALRLRQILVNLAGNAIKFTQFGEVVISLRGKRLGSGQVALEVAVRDTGIGIAPENQARIFEGFTQAEATTTRRFGGTGLGLVICQRLVRLMGGELQLQSQLGRGTVFSFSVVLGVPRHTVPDAAPALSAPALEVLIVDDNDIARDTLASMAVANGWTVHAVDSGEAAIECLSRAREQGRRFDAVFMDWHMPGLDGWESARRLRAAPLRDAMDLLIMVTAHGRELLESKDLSEKSLLDGYLIKPVTGSMLVDALKTARAERDGPPLLQLPAQHAGALQDLRILLVEDNETNQQVACELLAQEGARVTVAGNGRIAVDLLAADSAAFELVLMDVQMPVMDGYTATRCIRGELGLTALPVIAMTANAMASDREASLEAGMTDHVGKPFDLARLVQVIQRHATKAHPLSASGGGDAPAALDVPPAALALAGRHHIDLHAALHRLGGSTKAYARFLARFVEDQPRQLAELRSSVAAADFKAGARVAHTLKGLAGTLGITPLVDLAFRAEKALAAARHVSHGDEPLRLLDGFDLAPLRALLDELSTPAGTTQTPANLLAPQGLQGVHILLVDDSDINLDVTQHQLQRLGAVATCASSGAEALTQLAAWPQRFDAVLMDVQMPDMDGLETTRRIRRELALGTLPVIALSAGTQPSDRQDALDAGMNDFLSKALDLQLLQRVLCEQIERARAAATGSIAAAAPRTVLPGMDHAVALDRMGGDEALLRRSLCRLLDEFGPLQHTPMTTEPDLAARAALAARMHKLKGGAGLVEARKLYAVARALEDLLRGQAPWSAVVLLWAPLCEALAELEDATRDLRAPDPVQAPGVQGTPSIGDDALMVLRQMLLDQNLEALSFFAVQRDALAARLGPALVQRLTDLLDGLDFAEAAGLIPQTSVV